MSDQYAERERQAFRAVVEAVMEEADKYIAWSQMTGMKTVGCASEFNHLSDALHVKRLVEAVLRHHEVAL